MSLTVMDLLFEEGQTNMGGTRGKVYYVPASHIKTMPALEADGITLTAAIELQTGKRWAEVYTTKDTCSIVDKPAGEIDGKSFETELEFFHPKIRAEVLKLQTLLNNGGFVFVAKDANGVARLIGSPELPAYSMGGESNAGKAPKDRNGVSFKFSAASPTPAPIYPFAISLAAAA